MNISGMVVTDVWKEFRYSLRNRNKEKILGVNLKKNSIWGADEKLESNLSPYDVLRNP